MLEIKNEYQEALKKMNLNEENFIELIEAYVKSSSIKTLIRLAENEYHSQKIDFKKK